MHGPDSLPSQPVIAKRAAAPRGGIIIALWIPTDATGRIVRTALMAHLNWLKRKGVHGILALGTTGEFPRMNLAERERVLAEVIELAHPLPVIANISSIRQDEVEALGKCAVRLGAVGAAILPPWFFPLRQDDQLEFFLRAAESVSLPFYLYNFPEMTGNRIGPEVIAGFAQRAPLAGFKQSGGEFGYHTELIALGKQWGFSVFTGADPSLASLLDRGVAGCVSGYGNFAPEALIGVYDAHLSSRQEGAKIDALQLQKIGAIADTLPVPLNVRSGVEARGIDPGDWKTVVAPSTRQAYVVGVHAFQAAFREWGLPPFE